MLGTVEKQLESLENVSWAQPARCDNALLALGGSEPLIPIADAADASVGPDSAYYFALIDDLRITD